MKTRKKFSSRILAMLLALVMILSPIASIPVYAAGVLDTIGTIAPVFTVVNGAITFAGSIYDAVDCAIKADEGDGVSQFFIGLLGKKEDNKLNGIESTVKGMDGKIDAITKTLDELSGKTDAILTQVSDILNTLNAGVDSITVNLYNNQLQMREWSSTYTQLNNFYTKYGDVRRTLETTIRTLNNRSGDYDRFLEAVSARSDGAAILSAIDKLNIDCSNYDSLSSSEQQYLNTSIELDGTSYTVYKYISDYSTFVRNELKRIYDKFQSGYSTDMYMSLLNMTDYIVGENWTNGGNGGIGEIYYKLCVMGMNNSDEVHRAYESFVASVQYDFLLTAYVCSLSLKSQIASSTNSAEIATLTGYLNNVDDVIAHVLNYSDYEYNKCVRAYDFDGFTPAGNLTYDDYIVYYGNPANLVNEGIEKTRFVSRKYNSWGGLAQVSNQYISLAAGEAEQVRVWYKGEEIQGDYEFSSSNDCVIVNENGTVVGVYPGTATIRLKIGSNLYNIANVTVRSSYAKYNGSGTNTYVYTENGVSKSYSCPGEGYVYEYCADIEAVKGAIDSSASGSAVIENCVTLQNGVSISDYNVSVNHKYGRYVASDSTPWVQFSQAYTGAVVLEKKTDSAKSVVILPITNGSRTKLPSDEVTYISNDYYQHTSGYDRYTDTYYIYTKEDLINWRNAYDTDYTSPKCNVKLMADIDFEWGEWSGMQYALVQKIFPGWMTDMDDTWMYHINESDFTVKTYAFDGNGHTIKNINFTATDSKIWSYSYDDNGLLVCTSEDVITYGFFAQLAGTLKNLTIENVKYSGYMTPYNIWEYDPKISKIPDILSVFTSLADSGLYRMSVNPNFDEDNPAEEIVPINITYPCEVLNCKVTGTTETVKNPLVMHYDPFGGLWDSVKGDTKQTIKVANCIYETDFLYDADNTYVAAGETTRYFTAFCTSDPNFFAGSINTVNAHSIVSYESSVVYTKGMTDAEKAAVKNNVRAVPANSTGGVNDYLATYKELTNESFWTSRGWTSAQAKRIAEGNIFGIDTGRYTVDISAMKRVYFVGEALDTNNLVVYSKDGTRVTPSVETIDTSTAGTKTVTVRIGDDRANFTVEYKEKSSSLCALNFEYNGTSYTKYAVVGDKFTMPNAMFEQDGTGYYQGGWHLKGDDSTTYMIGQSVTINGSATYEPTWFEGDMCTLYFNNGTMIKVPKGATVILPDGQDTENIYNRFLYWKRWVYARRLDQFGKPTGEILKQYYEGERDTPPRVKQYNSGTEFIVTKDEYFDGEWFYAPPRGSIEVTFYMQNMDDDGYSLLGTASSSSTSGISIDASNYPWFFEKVYPGAASDWITSDTIVKSEAEGQLGEGANHSYVLGTNTKITVWLKRPSFTVTWNDKDGNTVKTETLKMGTVPTPPADSDAAPAGYTPVWDKSITELIADTTYTVADYVPAPDTAYTVNHYWQNVDDDEYTLHEYETLTGTTGLETSAVAKNYTGVTPKTFSQTTIAGDGTTVVDIYYDRNLYTVTWDVEGTTSTEQYRYGATPSYKGETPQKAADAQYNYAFIGWGEIVPVEDNVTYTALFSNALNSYTITWDIDGVQTTEEYKYGETPSYKGEIPTRDATAQYTYTFKDWGEITEVTGNKTYTANFNSVLNKYTITWDIEGEQVTEEYEYGQIPYYKGVTPKKDADTANAYTFNGWGQIEAVTGDKTYTAVFVPTSNKYTITWDVNGEKFTELYAYSETPSYKGVTPTKPATAQYTYTFKDWGEITEVTGDKTYTAVFTETVNKYIVTWNIDGNQTTEEYEYGATPSYKGETPVRATDAQYTYSFRDWGTILTVTGNKTYTANFNSVVNKYNITWNIDGVQFTETYDYGAMPVYKGYTPTKNATSQYSYTFAGWGDIVMVTGNKTYTAVFERTVNKYTITWNIDGNQITEEYEYGEIPSYKGEVPVKEGTAQYTYTFKDWGSVTTVTENKTYTARFEQTVNKYTITWSINGVETTEEYEYGATPSYKGDKPTKKSTEQLVYTFAGWGDITEVTGDKTYTATFESQPRTYTIVWVVDGKRTEEQYEYGKTPYYKGETPARENTAQYTYTFNGWGDITAVTDDKTYTAEFLSVVNKYIITWNIDGKLTEEEYEYGKTPYYKGATPAKDATAQYTYTFSSWGQITEVSADKTYTAEFTSTVNKYTITWDIEGEKATEEYEYGATPVYKGYKPTKPASEQYTYTFAGWGDVTKVTGDKTYTAVFEATYIVPQKITSSVFNVGENDISRISEGTKSSEFLAALNEGKYCKVFKGDAVVSGDTAIGTGMTVSILDGNSKIKTYTAIVSGDTNGDGNITITDMLAVKAHILGKTKLDGASYIAADTSGDGAVSITDFLQQKAHILGKSDINAQ